MRLVFERWVYFVLGGALFVPYALFAVLAVPLMEPSSWVDHHTAAQVVMLCVLTLILLALSGLLPVVRVLEAVIVPALLGGHATGLVVHPPRTPSGRVRIVAWFVGHAVGGAAVALATVLVAPIAVMLLVSSWGWGSAVSLRLVDVSVPRPWGLPLALALLAVLLVLIVLSGWLASWTAPVLLGPDPVARLVELERRTTQLVERGRLAQELHDSLGHALAVTGLQASAARTVLRRDPNFAEQALDTIAETARRAAEDLDSVLGLLRESAAQRAPQPSLRDLDALVSSHRRSGLHLQVTVEGDLTVVAAPVSREVYRVVQEALANVVRHGAEGEAASLGLWVEAGRLRLAVGNPVRAARSRPRRGGMGLRNVAERIELLGGTMSTSQTGERWLLEAAVPTGRSAR